MSDRQFHLTSPLQDSALQDSCTQFSSFEDSSTSPIMVNGNEDLNEAAVGVESVDLTGNENFVEVVDEEEPNPFEKKARKRTSEVWNDFDEVTLQDGTKKSQCKFCKQTFVRQTDNIQPTKSDLDIYLEEGVYRCVSHGEEIVDPHFDALEWWKANTLKYRILSKMACDILSIPITSVASESTFSA